MKKPGSLMVWPATYQAEDREFEPGVFRNLYANLIRNLP